jgi:dihydroxyacid dehydratase/phosphogluconate dehydratase
VVNSHTEFNPDQMHLDRLAQRVKDGVHAGGGIPYEFNVTCSSSATRGPKADRACPKPSP